MQAENKKSLRDQLIEKAGDMAAIAKFLGISHQAVQQWERIPLTHAKKLSEQYSVPLEAFFEQ